MMDFVKTTEMAHALYRGKGDKAEWLAAQREKMFKDVGDEAEAANWRAIRSSVRRLRGANQG